MSAFISATLGESGSLDVPSISDTIPSSIQLEAEPEQGPEQILKEKCEEMFSHFNHKTLEAMLRATRLSLDLIRKRVFFTA